MRKYLSEFGLNVYTSYKTLLPIDGLKDFVDEHKSHIYFILSCPKLTLQKDSIYTNKNGINFRLKKIVNGNEVYETIENFKFIKDINYEKVKAITNYPYNILELDIDDEKYRSYYGENLFCIYVQTLYNWAKPHSNWCLNVEYIGQAYGKDGSRIATDRLSSHSTMQKILIDCYTNFPDKQIYVLLLEFQEKLMMSVDGKNPQFSESKQKDAEHHNAIFNDLPRENQVINITEAALINYFKPPYNNKFIENFPDKKHGSYKQYFALDYNALTVELDLEFDRTPGIHLATNNASIKSSWDFIRYNLYNDPNRSDMYQIFKENTNDNNSISEEVGSLIKILNKENDD